jgi:NADPH-dependent 2,4-dienoyl-CoA reductase/sulfur reductase-like enzyme
MIGQEPGLPYNRPPLTKDLWFGREEVSEIFVHDQKYYDDNGVTLLPNTLARAVDPVKKTVLDNSGKVHRYQKLLLATGAFPRDLAIPGGYLPGIYYYRFLDDYQRLRAEVAPGRTATVIGGGFIGSEMAAALNLQNVDVTMVFPERWINSRVFPEELGMALTERFRDRGINVLSEDKPFLFSKNGMRFSTVTQAGRQFETDILLIGIGVVPETSLAMTAGLQINNGIVVNEYLQSSQPDIFAAGDNAWFPYQALGKPLRVEHWDNAQAQGRLAGRNMAGAREAYTYLPDFMSEMFDFHYAAVGEVNAALRTVADWQKKNETGAIYYIGEDKVRGVLLCNQQERLEEARDLIRRGTVPAFLYAGAR